MVVSVRLPVAVVAEWERRASRNGRTLGAHLRLKLVEAVRGTLPAFEGVKFKAPVPEAHDVVDRT